MRDKKVRELPEYLEDYAEYVERGSESYYDKEAMEFYRDFVPLYVKYAGTKSLLKHLREYIKTHEITRKDDFRCQLVSMWCLHIQYYRELHNIPFKAEDIFKIKIPKEILNLQ